MATSTEANSVDDADNILYDLLVLSEWPQEPETLTKVIAEKPKGSIVGKLSSVANRSLWTFLRSTGMPLRTSTPCSLPAPLIKLVNAQSNWQLATTSNDKLLAVLQDSYIEVRSFRDDYATSLGKCTIPKDPYPQWRKLAWSPDCTMLACSDSSGNVRVLDLLGSVLFTIKKTSSKQQIPGSPLDLSCAVASLIFTEYKQTTQWSAELIVITYHGSLHSYLVSLADGFIPNHSFQFSNEHPLGISSAVYLPVRSLLLIGCCSQEEGQDANNMAAQYGITAWRRLDDAPYYKMVTDYSGELTKSRSSRRLLRRVTSMSLFNRSNKQDGIYKMCLSPEGNQLVTVHQSGLVALWDVPSLKNSSMWTLEKQPGYDEKNPNILIPSKKKPAEGQPAPHSLIDINFWSEKALILARYSGAVSVASTRHLTNLLGDSCEWFEPAPRVNQASDKGFLSIECESKTSALKRRRMPSDTEHDDSKSQTSRDGDDDSEDDEDEDATIIMRSTKLMKQAMYFITESETFQPPRKRPKVVSRTYRLVSLQKTTPEELYARRIENEEYGEALVLARRFGLDADLVYQRQWRKAPVSIAAIQDYLSKITKRAWVLHECLERVPEDIDAARELLQYGLRGTDLEALVAIGRGEDHGRFILSPDAEAEESFETEDPTPDTEQQTAKEKKEQLVLQVNFNSLTLEQRELCRCRLKLLTYLDRLRTYEVILGGGEAAARFFSDHFFKTFRAQNIVEATVQFARDSDWQAVETLFTHHGRDLLPHWLLILNNFPETTSPAEYSSLFPEASPDSSGDSEVLEWEFIQDRDDDWSESPICQAAINPTPVDYGAFLYEECPELAHFRADKLTKALLTDWFIWRATTIERQSRQVDNALELVDLGIERNVQGLKALHDDLVTLEVMTYECQTQPGITLDTLQTMSDLDKVLLMMSKSPKEMYVKNIKRWVIPFLDRGERQHLGKRNELLTQYMLCMAKEDLTNCVMIFENSKSMNAGSIVTESHLLMSLALQCVYASERNDQLSLTLAVLHCMPRRSFGMQSEETSALHDQLGHLSDHLRAAEILLAHDVPKPPKFIQDTQTDKEQAKGLMIRLSRQAARRKPPLKSGEWKQLLRDMLELQRKVYTCLDQQLCYEVYTESLLGSSSLPNIQLAGEMLTTSSSLPTASSSSATSSSQDSSAGSSYNLVKGQHSTMLPRIDYETSVELVLSAAREYFNSSADLMDSCMDLARCCLQLLTDCPSGVQEELDLIASLALLDDYNVSILPLQVRLSANRLELVKTVLASMPSAYKDSKQLLRLSKLLRVSGTNAEDRKGLVLVLVAEAALAVSDYRGMHHTCTQLIQDGYSPGWSVCYTLAMAEEFRDLSAKRELLSFSLAHSDAESLQVIMKARNALETQILCLSVNAHSSHSTASTTVTDAEEQDPEAIDDMEVDTAEALQPEDQTALRAALGKTTAKTRQVLAATGTTTKAVLAATGTTTKAVLAAVGDRKWWKDTLKWVRPLGGNNSDMAEVYGVIGHGNAKMERHGCHPFYSTMISNHYVGKEQIDYSVYRISQNDGAPVKVSQDLLRAGLMEGTSEPNLVTQNEVLLQVALEVMTYDLTQGLCLLLALPNPLDAEQCFEKLPRTALTLQLAAYYYALQLNSSTNTTTVMTPDLRYQQSPSKLIGQVVSQVTGDNGGDWSDVEKSLVSQLQCYVELLADFTQAESLQALGRGVDVARFTQDKEYKHETILGLAMTTEEEVYKLSVSLAHRYHLPLWEVYMTHLEFLFTDSGFKTPKLEEYISALGILPTLTSKPIDFADRLNLYVFPTIEGSDHNRLIYYYSLLHKCGSKIKTGSVTPDTHIKSLKKLKSAAPGLDYKSLLDGETDPVDVIGPVLSGANVHVIAKVAAKIPLQGGGNLSSSQVFLAYIIKLFWEGDQGFKKAPESIADWLHRYEGCGELFNRINPADFTSFISNVIFTEDSIQKLELDCRQKIVTRALKFSRQQTGKQKLATAVGAFTVDWASERLQQYLKHLQSLESDGVQDLKDYDKQKTGSSFTVQYDLTQGDTDKMKNLMMSLLTGGATLELIDGLLKQTTLDKWTSLSAVQHTLQALMTSLMGDKDEKPGRGLEDVETLLSKMETVLTTVNQHEQQQGTLIKASQVLDVLRPFCSDSSIDAKLRINLLLILERTFNLDEEDSMLLLFYRTEALVSTLWKQQVSEEDVATNEARQRLFTSLLQSSQAMDQLITLSKLLQQWPPLQVSSTETADTPWVQLLIEWIQHEDSCQHEEVLLKLFEYFQENDVISSECVEVLYQELVAQGAMLTAMKLVLVTRDTRLYPLILEYMQQDTKISPSSYDNQLFCLLVDNDLVAKVATTPYYAPLIQFLLTSQEAEPLKPKVKVIVGQLRAAGHETAAGTLLLRFQGAHSMFGTLDTAYSALKCWLGK
ncbi:neuroblastoma-amplified sequence-like [Asterias rubens]|uniref:neuroblastoma-amplified sequence-like n=1 Tax=Asterias rubens TaxID=7604 RepID=UPI00145538E3|nr:neuroblastoma-amplified sequence-like [Asterias rubens]